ncbi:carboxypeptidase-like regulatory domain-containing protein [Bacteroidota bacterium]
MINYQLLKRFIRFNLILFFSLTPLIHSQSAGTLRGFVTDSTNSEALPYGNVYIQELNTGASTDSRGYFLIPSVPADHQYTLIVSYLGYLTKKIPIEVSPDRVTHMDIVMSPSSVELQAVEKIGERVVEENATDISLQRLTVKELEALPMGVETDIIRSLHYMPGVQSTGDVSARYYVRGGSSDQNLVLLDNIPIYSPFHAMGLFSVVDPDIVNNIEFYKGGFGSEFGGRASSVLKVITKDGNKNNYGAKFSSSYLSGKLLLEGPIPYGSFTLTGRKSYSSKILNKFLNNKNIPVDFYDFSFKMNYSNPDFLKGGKIIVTGFLSGDNITNSSPAVEDYKWNNQLLGFKWFQVGDSPLFLELGIAVSNFTGELIPKVSGAKGVINEVNDLGLTMDFTYMYDAGDELGVGFHIKQLKTELSIENDYSTVTNYGDSGANISIYAKYIFKRFKDFGIDFGTRLNLVGLAGGRKSIHMLEPRVSFTYNLLTGFAIKGAYGIYQQELTTVSDENEVINIFEPWLVTPNYLEPTTAIHYILGFDSSPFDNISLSVEGYYKKMYSLPILNDNKIYSTDPDFLKGKGESYGIESLLKIRPYPLNFSASYTLAYAYKEVDNKRYYPRYDARHSLNLTLGYSFGSGWEASIVWIYSSGLPFTQLQGFYNKLYLNNFFYNWNQVDPRHPYTVLSTRNLGRLPDYHRLDISLSKKFSFNFMNLYLDISIVNVYDRANIFYFKRDSGERVNMLPFLPTATLKVEL